MSPLTNIDKAKPVLIVDHQETMRRITRNYLRQLGFENVVEAEDGQAAWEQLNAGEFQLVISDWQMPNMMGMDLLKAIQNDPKLKAVPFLMVAALAQKGDVTKATNIGLSNYIMKPFTAGILEQKLSDILAKE